MNKFKDPQCEDYKQVTTEVKGILQKIRETRTLLEEADAHIRDHYLAHNGRLLAITAIWREVANGAVLRRHGDFYHTLLGDCNLSSLYKNGLRGSFVEQFSWYVEKSHLCMNLPDGIKKIPVHDDQDEIVARIKEARPANFPAICGEA